MTSYLLIESRDPFQNGLGDDHTLAGDLASGGDRVTLFLVQNGVLPARSGARNDGLRRLLDQGITVLADEFSLRERGIDPARLACGVQPVAIESVVDELASGSKAIWC